MRILLVSANRERLNMRTLPLGLGQVAAAVRRAGHDVHLLDMVVQRDPVSAVANALAEHDPEVLGVSVRNIDDQSRMNPRFLLGQAREVVAASRALRPDLPIVLGGPGYSIFPAQALAWLGADLGVAGDGEIAFPAVLERLKAGVDPSDVPGVFTRGRPGCPERHLSPDLDVLPAWDDALCASVDPTDPDLWIPIQGRRGCANACSYCATSQIQGRTLRSRSPELVARTVAHLAERGFRRFYFVDNSFNIPEPWAFALCRQIRALGLALTWRCILYPHDVNEDLVEEMATSGCVEVSLGFESGSPTVLANMNKRFLPDEVARIAAMLRRHGIRRMGFLLLGGPGETRETVEQSLSFAASLGLDGLRLTAGIRIYPGTELARRARAEGLLHPDDDLLFPRFYLATGLEPWIDDRLADFERSFETSLSS
jgi:radical SAM superfamily enzyme YgiQ (UPF0313 family)